MSLALGIVVFLALLAVWALAWRNHPALAFGMAIGILISWLAAAFIGDISMEHVPLWLPPLPFALVAITLIGFGVLAWFWGQPSDDARSHSPQSGPHHRH
jgi:hypothetical protein